MPIITPSDVAGATPGMAPTLVQNLVAGANAKAERVNPMLADTTDQAALAEAKLILVGAVKRWAQAGSGSFSQQTIGPSSVSLDTRQQSVGFNLWPSEIAQLRELGQECDEDRAFSISMIRRSRTSNVHPFTVA